jgi:hypothetical protein
MVAAPRSRAEISIVPDWMDWKIQNRLPGW